MSSYGTPSDGAPYPAPVLLYDDPAQPPRSPPFRSFSYTDPDSRDSVDYEDASGDLAYALSNEPEKGEWFQAAGSYQQGVGFEGSDRSGGAKERTMARMEHLERKFGEQAASHSAGGTAKDHIRVAKEAKMAEKMELQRATGVDEKGRLVVVGRRKRSALRWFQAGGAVVVGIGSIGASVLAHPKEKPPPSGSALLLILYLLPFLCLSLTTYLFVVRPWLYKRRASQSSQPQNGLVTPLLQQQPPLTSSGCCPCFGSSRRRVPRSQYHPPQINLIVNPELMAAMQGQGMLEGGRAQRDERDKRRKKRRRRRAPAHDQVRHASDSASTLSSDDSLSDLFSAEEDDPWTSHPRSSSSHPRKTLLSHVLLDVTWRAARTWAKKVAVADAACAVVWGGVAGWAVFGETRCPAGGFEGYCNLYNTALAFSVLLSASFVASFALDCFDLSRTKVSPRHRQQRLRVGAV